MEQTRSKRELEAEITAMQQKKEKLVRSQRFAEAADIVKHIQELKEQLKTAK